MLKRTTAVFLILFFTVLFTVLFFYDLNSKSEKFYLQGLNFEQTEDFSNAYYNFSKIPFTSKFYPLSLYKRANCALKTDDKKTALRSFKKFSNVAKDNNLAPIGLFYTANLELDFGHKNKALKIYEKLQKKYPKSDFSHAANYKIGVIKNDDKYLAAYLKYAPIGRYSDAAIKNLEKNQNLSEDFKLLIAISKFHKKDFPKALFYLKQVPFEKSWYYLAKTYENLNDKIHALNAYEIGLSNLKSNTNLTNAEILDALFSYNLLSPKNWTKLAQITNKNDNPAKIPAMFYLAQNSNIHNAQKIYGQIYFKNPKSDYATPSLDELILYAYLTGNYKNALEFSKNSETASAKGLYFLAKTYEKTGNRAKARGIYKKIIEEYPNNYYAFRASAELSGKNNFKTIKKPVKLHKTIAFPSVSSKYLSLLASLKDYSAIKDFKIENEFLKSYLAYIDGRHGYSERIATNEIEKIKNKRNIPKSAWQLAYPIYYENAVNKYAKALNLSPYLALALIKEESHFDTDAKSSVGATGLTQIMPSTAQFVMGKSYNPVLLNQINYNIYAGLKYFSHLKNEFNGNDMLAILAYNAGPNAVKNWLSRGALTDYDDFIETIPYFETRNYVKKVFSAYSNYLRIYE